MIHGARAKPARVVLPRILIDLFGVPQKTGFFFEKAPIMIQIMDVEFETAAANFAHEAIGNFVALLGHDLEGGLEPM